LIVRPYWKGHLKLALVSCPIGLHAACSTAERIAFRQISKATGNRLRQQLIDEETREPVAPEDKGRGYEVARGACPWWAGVARTEWSFARVQVVCTRENLSLLTRRHPQPAFPLETCHATQRLLSLT
jgi:hypothetical protein